MQHRRCLFRRLAREHLKRSLLASASKKFLVGRCNLNANFSWRLWTFPLRMRKCSIGSHKYRKFAQLFLQESFHSCYRTPGIPSKPSTKYWTDTGLPFISEKRQYAVGSSAIGKASGRLGWPSGRFCEVKEVPLGFGTTMPEGF